MNMKTRNTLAALLLVLAGSAHATDASVGRMTWNCHQAGAPDLQAVKELFDTPSNYLAARLRERLVSRLRAECQRGSSNVLVVLKQAPPATERILVAATDPRTQAHREATTH